MIGWARSSKATWPQRQLPLANTEWVMTDLLSPQSFSEGFWRRALWPGGNPVRQCQPGLFVLHPDMRDRLQRRAVIQRAGAQHLQARRGAGGVVESGMTDTAEGVTGIQTVAVIGVYSDRTFSVNGAFRHQRMQGKGAAAPGLAVAAMAGVDRQRQVGSQVIAHGATAALTSEWHR